MSMPRLDASTVLLALVLCAGSAFAEAPNLGKPVDPASIAADLKAIATQDGPTCVFNLHLSSSPGAPITFPDSDSSLSDKFARSLFQMSSTLPPPIATGARNEGFAITDGTRGFVFNAHIIHTIQFLDIGTRVSGLR